MSEDIRSGHLTPRSKLFSESAASLSEAELLAVLLQAGWRPEPALDLSRRLLARFGGLRKLLHAERRALAAEGGVGDARLAVLQVLPELQQVLSELLLVWQQGVPQQLVQQLQVLMP